MDFPPPVTPAPPTPGPLLLTGATGFLGMELLARCLERTDRTVYALVSVSFTLPLAEARDALRLPA
jgi:nucleoside-diphosphate-sugar epimerase